MRVSRTRSPALEPQAQIGAQAQRRLDPVGLADSVPIRLSDVPPRPLPAPVVESGLAVDLDVDEAVEAAEDAEQDVLGLPVARGADIPLRAVVVVMPGSDQQHVAHLEPPGGRAPGRLQDHGSRQVATAGRDRPIHRPRAEPSRMTVEDRREDARPVHLRQRQPLDVPVRRHERADLAVGEQRVVGNRWKRTSAKGMSRSGPSPVGSSSSTRRLYFTCESRAVARRASARRMIPVIPVFRCAYATLGLQRFVTKPCSRMGSNYTQILYTGRRQC